MLPLLTQYFRCLNSFGDFTVEGELSKEPGFFRFGPDVVCYGRSSSQSLAPSPEQQLCDVSGTVVLGKEGVRVPFNPAEIIENLRTETYAARHVPSAKEHGLLRGAYYSIRPFLPLSIRKHLQKIYFRNWEQRSFPKWPVDRTVDNLMQRLMILALKASGKNSIPFIWFWPDGANAGAVMTHDVEAEQGKQFCSKLMDLNESFGIPASFQIVPEDRYSVEPQFLAQIRNRGFEINIHDLNHDGRLFEEKSEFERRVKKINQYGADFGAVGFRSAVLYRNPQWFSSLRFEYDMSIPNVAHLDPQWGGCCTVMPYFIGGLLEIPVTTIQDHSLFNVLNDFTMRLWQEQAKIILEQNGLMNFLVHPDYILGERQQDSYKSLLDFLLKLRAERRVWVALPREVNTWWRQRDRMVLTAEGQGWRIQGEGSERARVAIASLEGDHLMYSFNDGATSPATHALDTTNHPTRQPA